MRRLLSVPQRAPHGRAARRAASIGGLLLIVLALLGPGAAAAGGSLPRSMASTGDSITRAATTGILPWTDNPAGSWSTGTDSRVNSHYLRLLALNPKIEGKNANDARSGAKMTDLAGQMTTVVNQRVDYVTILMGGNDVCTGTEAGMTSVAAFRTQFTSAMDRLTTGLPSAKVFVGSIPNVYHLWALEKDNSTARFVWDLLDVCQSMLANPLSTEQADVDRRARVLQREQDFNTVLSQVCAAYRQCRYDGGAVFATDFTRSDVGSWDYFHPSIAGQAKLAAGTWTLSYWGP